jgi:hypothetical protein
MKSNGTNTMLTWALNIVVVLTAIFGFQYFNKTREVRSLQGKVVEYQNKQAMLQNLVAECLEYSKRNSSIDLILEANNVKPKANATPAPAAKPAGK